ncbi:MAG: Fic family protein [Bacteroidales bacterium]|nr:Fic family protein [Bacteroidales bacterium]
MNLFKSGVFVNQGSFKSFVPSLINRAWTINDMNVLSLLSKADRMLGRLDMFSEYIPNIDLFISMHIAKEATLSSKIEGTQTNIQQAVMPEESVPLDKRDDWAEIQNYISAINQAIPRLESLPLSSRLIREVHSELMKGVRGKNKQPGEFRLSQNWIGGANINDAIFIPPPANMIYDLMSDIEKFIHNSETQLPDLLKIAIIHYQFETIHPFNDGNGRTGRLLITLYLVSKGLLKRPVLYMSDYLEKHRNSYYSSIMKVRTDNDLSQWLSFFLQGIIETAEKGVNTFNKILSLEKDQEAIVRQMGSRSANAMTVIKELYMRPVVDAKKVAKVCDISVASAYNLISELEKRGILTEITGGKRNCFYAMQSYLDLFR